MDGQEIKQGKTFVAIQEPKKETTTQNFDEEVFKTKVVEGYSQKDAAVVAGYKGNNPTRFGSEVASQPAVKASLESLFEKRARMALRNIKANKVKGASLVQLATTAGIMARNAREERSQGIPQQHLHLHVDLSTLSTEEIRQYLEKASRARSDG